MEHYQTQSSSDSAHQSFYHHYHHVPTGEVATVELPAGHDSRGQVDHQQDRCDLAYLTDQSENLRPPGVTERSSDMLQKYNKFEEMIRKSEATKQQKSE